MGCLRLFPWTDPPGAADSTIHTRFLKRRAPPRCSGACHRLMHGNAARKKPPPRRYPAHGRRHPACSQAQTLPPTRRAAHAQHRHSQMDEARRKAGPVACRGMQPSRSHGACHLPDSHGQRERAPAAPRLRRSVEPVGVAGPIQLDGRSPARGRAGGVRPVRHVTAAGRGASQAPGKGGASGCPDRYHLRPRAQRVQVVRPRLQHRPALLEELRPVVGTPQRIRHSMG